MRGNLMTDRNSVASILTAWCAGGQLPRHCAVANAAAVGLSVHEGRRKRQESYDLRSEVGHGGRGGGGGGGPAVLTCPIAPSYCAYDYPYYYSRGHYPTLIGHGLCLLRLSYSYYIRNYNAEIRRRGAPGNALKAG